MAMPENDIRGGFTLTCQPACGDEQLAVRSLNVGRGAAAEQVFVGYRRCREYDDVDGEGQDDAWLYADPERVIGVVADGVSQSFYGQIAARRLVHGLAQYLHGVDVLDDSPRSKELLVQELRRIAAAAAEEVEAKQLRAGLSDVMQEGLEKDRRNGSQAVVGAFVFDRKSRRLAVCQLGDIRIRVFRAAGPGELVKANKMGRFSTVATAREEDAGCETDLVLATYSDALGVVVHSDGVDDGWGAAPAGLDAARHEVLADVMRSWARRDDVSMAGVLIGPLIAWVSRNELEAPADAPSQDRFNGSAGSPPAAAAPKVETVTSIRVTESPDTVTSMTRTVRSGKRLRIRTEALTVTACVLLMMAASFALGRQIGASGTRPPGPGPVINPPPAAQVVTAAELKQWAKTGQDLQKRITDFAKTGYSDNPDPDPESQNKTLLAIRDECVKLTHAINAAANKAGQSESERGHDE